MRSTQRKSNGSDFARDDEFYRRLGAAPCRIARCHWGEIGIRALPYLKERGRTLICTPFHAGEHKADQYEHGDGRFPVPAGEGYWPYDTVQCFYDYLPDDNDFYIFGSFGERHLADFLTGATVLLRESPRNDPQKAADQGARQIGHGLRSGFYGEILTHEQKLGVLALREWDAVLAGVKRRLGQYDIVRPTTRPSGITCWTERPAAWTRPSSPAAHPWRASSAKLRRICGFPCSATSMTRLSAAACACPLSKTKSLCPPE